MPNFKNDTLPATIQENLPKFTKKEYAYPQSVFFNDADERACIRKIKNYWEASDRCISMDAAKFDTQLDAYLFIVLARRVGLDRLIEQATHLRNFGHGEAGPVKDEEWLAHCAEQFEQLIK
jgi:hypothetical protein